MKNTLFIILLFSAFASSNGQTLNWVKQAGTTSYDLNSKIATDALGNVFLSGCIFNDTLNVWGNNLIVPYNSISSLFLIKCDSTTNTILWSVFFPASSGGIIEDVCVDQSGNTIITGSFSDELIIGNDTLSDPTFDATGFLISINPSGGLNWYRHLSSSCELNPRRVVTDNSGNIYTCGRFYCNGQFDTISINTLGYENFYLAKFSANGNALWVKNGTGKEMLSLNYSSTGIIRACTNYWDSLTIANSTIYSNSPYETLALISYDSIGTLTRMINYGHCASGTSDILITGLETDNLDNIFISGSFDSSVVFVDTTINSYHDHDVFILKLNSNGQNYSFHRYGGVHNDLSYSMVTDHNGDSYLCGSFEGAMSFDGNWYFTAGSRGVFICHVDSSFNVLWVLNSDMNYSSEGQDLTLSSEGKLYVTGTMNGPLDWGPWNLNTFGQEDFWIARISDLTSGVPGIINENENKLKVYPNPSSGIVLVSGLPRLSGLISVFNIQGQILNEFPTKGLLDETTVSLSYLPGIYLIQFISDDNSFIKRSKLVIE